MEMIGYEDVIIAVLLIVFSITGFKNGLILGVFSLVAWIVGIFVAYHFSYIMLGWLQEFHFNPMLIKAMSYVLTFVAVVLLIILLGKIIKRLASLLALGTIDRIFGLLLGILKGALLASIVLYLMTSILKTPTASQNHTVLYKAVQPIVPWCVKQMDKEVDLDQIGVDL